MKHILFRMTALLLATAMSSFSSSHSAAINRSTEHLYTMAGGSIKFIAEAEVSYDGRGVRRAVKARKSGDVVEKFRYANTNSNASQNERRCLVCIVSREALNQGSGAGHSGGKLKQQS